jgi:hypothetical protein
MKYISSCRRNIMGTHKLSLSICVGDFYLVGKIDIENINIERKYAGFEMSFIVNDEDIKRVDDPEFCNTEAEARSNVIQIDFATGEKKWI